MIKYLMNSAKICLYDLSKYVYMTQSYTHKCGFDKSIKNNIKSPLMYVYEHFILFFFRAEV